MGTEMIGVIGLGKLGMPLAAVLGQGFEVVGVDKIENPREPNEPYLKELLRTARLEITTDFSALKHCDVIFCIVPTPSKANGEFTDKYIRDALVRARRYMGNCKVFNVVSTVMPGTCEGLQKLTNVPITYNPEFIALGNVVDGIVNPDFVLLGEDNEEAGDIIQGIYENITKAPIKRMKRISAELAKIALNSYVTMKISFANVLGEIAEEIGAEVEKITEAIGTDKRIGSKYFRAGPPYGGPCFPRDNRAFARVAGKIKNYASMTDQINERQIERMYRRIRDEIGDVKGMNISIIGMSYKEGTEVREESAGVKLFNLLKTKGANVYEHTITSKMDLIVFMLPGKDTLEEMAKNAGIKTMSMWK